MSALTDIKDVVLTLASGRPAPPGMCRHWTRSHAELVRSERLAPWVYRTLANREDCGLEPGIAAEFRHQYRLSSFAGLQRELALRNLLEVFDCHGIPIVFLKGAYLADCVYRDPATRLMVDVDVLVEEHDLPEAEEHLRSLGYTRLVNPTPLEHQVLLAPRPYGLPAPNRFSIDLHHGIRLIDYYRFPSEVLWSHRVEATLWGHKVFYLSPELNFIHLALHNLNHEGSLRDWLDLLLILRTIDLDWDLLVRLAEDLGAMRPLFWTCQELASDWRVTLPVRVSESLDTYVPHWLEDRMMRHRLRHFWRLVARMTLFDGWHPRIQYLLEKLVPLRGGSSRSPVLNWISRLPSKASIFLRPGN